MSEWGDTKRGGARSEGGHEARGAGARKKRLDAKVGNPRGGGRGATGAVAGPGGRRGRARAPLRGSLCGIVFVHVLVVISGVTGRGRIVVRGAVVATVRVVVADLAADAEERVHGVLLLFLLVRCLPLHRGLDGGVGGCAYVHLGVTVRVGRLDHHLCRSPRSTAEARAPPPFAARQGASDCAEPGLVGADDRRGMRPGERRPST